MAKILSMLESEGYRRIELLVARDNTRGIAFFESLGFEIEGTLRKYISRHGSSELYDEHIMALLLG